MREIFLSFLCLLSAITLTCAFDVGGECGKVKVRNPNALISNGEQLYYGQSPWLASLFIKEKNRYICGSSVITQWHLLSAAHCVIRSNFDDYYALMGRFDLSNPNEPHEQRRDIQFIHIHDTHNTTKFQKSTGDIAIFKVTEAIRFTDFVQPVCLPEPSTVDVKNIVGYLSGYGVTRPIQARNEDKPSFVELNSVQRWVCLDKGLIYLEVVSEFSYCAENNSSIPCQGDSGGGFYVYNKATHKYTTYGILSHGIGHCNPDEYVVFVEVPKYVQWIHEAIDGEKEIEDLFKTVSCDEIKCDEREECKVNNNIPECVCRADFTGNPPICIPKCFDDSKCPEDQACINGICIDLCSTANRCVANSQCLVINHKLKCKCNSVLQENESLCTHFINGTYITEYHYFKFDKNTEIKSKNIEINPEFRDDNNLVLQHIFYKSNFLPIKVYEVFPSLKTYQVTIGSMNEINQENFKNLNKLVEVVLTYNKVELVIKENSFNDLIDLKFLNLRFDRITELPEKLFENNRKLEKIVLNSNKLTSLSEELFQNLIELKELDLSANQLSTLPENIFKNLHKLQILDLSLNQLISLPEKLFENLTELKILKLNSNQLTTLPGEILIKNVKLENIHLNDNKITSLSYRIFENKLNNLQNLKYVGLEDNVCINEEYGYYRNKYPLGTDERESLRKDLQENCWARPKKIS